MIYLGYFLITVNLAVLARAVQAGLWGLATMVMVNIGILAFGVWAKKKEMGR